MILFFDYRLVFSQSLLSLDLIEDFLEHWDKAVKPDAPEEQVNVISACIMKCYLSCKGNKLDHFKFYNFLSKKYCNNFG